MKTAWPFAVIVVLLIANTAVAGRYGSVQSPARPLGLDIIDRVQLRNSDSRARKLNSTDYRWMRDVLNSSGGINQPLNGSVDTVLLDPGKIEFVTDYNVRMYFLSESAGHQNSLGFNPNGQGAAEGASLIFPNGSQGSSRSTQTPLRTGDFVDLGLIKGGSILDFFLIADGANGGSNVFTLDANSNPDGLRHVAIQARVDEDSPYLLLGFEDLLGGGDLDFEAGVFALDIGADNVRQVLNTVGAPEPGTFVVLGAFFTLGGISRRRRQKQANVEFDTDIP